MIDILGKGLALVHVGLSIMLMAFALNLREAEQKMASATRSLPVPLSPVMSTVTSRGAKRAMREARRCMLSEANTREPASASSPRMRSEYWQPT